MYRAIIRQKNYYSELHKKNIKEIDYNDLVYCIEVQKYNTLFVRRNGKPIFSSNCADETRYMCLFRRVRSGKRRQSMNASDILLPDRYY